MSRTFEPKWTPGPWLYRPKSGSWHVEPDIDTGYSFGRAFITTPDACEMEFRNEHDAELIALAPELAAAVLALEKLTCPTHTRLFGGDSFQTFAAHCVECRTIVRVQTLAERLRMIGADE